MKTKTDKFLLSLIGILSLAFIASVFFGNISKVVIADEGSEASGSGSEESGSSEKSEESEKSEDSEKSEESVESEVSEESDGGIIKRFFDSSEKSEESVVSEKSVESTVSEVSEKSEPSEKSMEMEIEMSEPSGEIEIELEGFDEVVSVSGNTAVLKKNEKLFFLFPVEIESEVTLDEKGNIVSEEKSIFSRILSFFSF